MDPGLGSGQLRASASLCLQSEVQGLLSCIPLPTLREKGGPAQECRSSVTGGEKWGLKLEEFRGPGLAVRTTGAEGGSRGMCRGRKKMHKLCCVMGNNSGVPPDPSTVWVDLGTILAPWKNDRGATCALNVLLRLSLGANRRVCVWITICERTEALVWPFVSPCQAPGDQSALGAPAHQTPKLPGPKLPGEFYKIP